MIERTRQQGQSRLRTRQGQVFFYKERPGGTLIVGFQLTFADTLKPHSKREMSLAIMSASLNMEALSGWWERRWVCVASSFSLFACSLLILTRSTFLVMVLLLNYDLAVSKLFLS